MSLEYKQFETILQHEQLESMIVNREFILSFLDQLYTNLKDLTTCNQCYEIYPQIGPLLTRASIHPFIGHDPDITKLVLSCLLEYAKLDLDPTSHNAALTKSNLWCITRLRRLINVSQPPNDGAVLIHKVLELLDNQTSSSIVLNSKISYACLGLMHQERAFPIIERFVHLAVSQQQQEEEMDTINFDPPQRLLSHLFLSHLATDKALYKHAVACWPNDTRARLLLHYSELVDTELLDLIATYSTDSYESIHAIQQHFFQQQHRLLKVAITSPALNRMLITKLASYVVILLDWRVVRIMQSVYRTLSCTEKWMPENNFKSVSHYIYSGPLASIDARRNTAWCLSLASVRHVWPLVNTLVNWSQTSDLWNCALEDILVYINWIICPTKDNRESRSFSDLKSWIQSNQNVFHSLASLWRKLFNDNAIILSLFVISILSHLHADQQVSLIQTIYFSHKSSITDDEMRAHVYILLDSLEELNTMIPTTTTHIINYIYAQL